MYCFGPRPTLHSLRNVAIKTERRAVHGPPAATLLHSSTAVSHSQEQGQRPATSATSENPSGWPATTRSYYKALVCRPDAIRTLSLHLNKSTCHHSQHTQKGCAWQAFTPPRPALGPTRRPGAYLSKPKAAPKFQNPSIDANSLSLHRQTWGWGAGDHTSNMNPQIPTCTHMQVHVYARTSTRAPTVTRMHIHSQSATDSTPTQTVTHTSAAVDVKDVDSSTDTPGFKGETDNKARVPATSTIVDVHPPCKDPCKLMCFLPTTISHSTNPLLTFVTYSISHKRGGRQGW
jgi:hypothetical protein